MPYKDKEKHKEYHRKYREKNREKVREINKKWVEENKEKKREINKKWREKNKEKIREYEKKRNEKNREDVRKYNREYSKKRKQSDPVYKLRELVSTTIANALKRREGSKQGDSIMSHLPYTIEEMKTHIENQFVAGMSWDNHGEWHIDHIYPQSKLPYDSMSHPNFLKCWSLENLQPLWAEENIKKSNKVLDRP